MAIWPFGGGRSGREARALLAAVVAASRNPGLFGPGKAADTLDGRFELLSLFAALALIRLRADATATALAQAFADALFRQIDAGLREAGVGDLSVPKQMRRLAGVFYGRLETYAKAIEVGDVRALAAALARNALGGSEGPFAGELSARVHALARRQALAPVTLLSSPEAWRLP